MPGAVTRTKNSAGHAAPRWVWKGKGGPNHENKRSPA